MKVEIDWRLPGSMSKIFPRRLFSVLRLSLLLCLLAGAIALLLQINSSQGSHANVALPGSDPASVVGQPTLPAATVDAIFASVGSPMVGTGKVVEQAARQANIDDAFALGVWWVETNDGAAGVGSADRNPGSVKASGGYPVAFDGYTIYPSYSAAILDWFNVLKVRYISRGLTTVYAISYPYVGTSSSPLWAGKVVAYMQRYRAEAPPPTPTPLPRPLHLASQNLPQKSKLVDQTQEAGPSAVAPAAPTRQPPAASAAPSTLSPAIRDAILLLGLLIALALVLYALALDSKLPLPALFRSRQAVRSAVTTESLHFPSTLTSLPPLPSTGLPALNSGEEMPRLLAPTPAVVNAALPATGALRRVTLRPALASEPRTTGLLSRASSFPTPDTGSDAELEPVPVSVSGMGLLSRYRSTHQREDISL